MLMFMADDNSSQPKWKDFYVREVVLMMAACGMMHHQAFLWAA